MASSLFRARNLTRGSEIAGQVEVADSFSARFRGLMGRASLLPGGGLWLTGTSNIHMFFMRFPIDAVFLGKAEPDGTRAVVAVRPGLRPGRRGRGESGNGSRFAISTPSDVFVVSLTDPGEVATAPTLPGELETLAGFWERVAPGATAQ